MSYLASHWTAAWPVLIGYAVVVGAHVTGLRDDPTRDLDRLTRRWTVGWPSRSRAGAAAWQPRPRYRRPTPMTHTRRMA